MTEMTALSPLSSASTRPTLARALVEILRFFGCREVYGVGGDYAANLIKALEGDFEVLPSSNELHAAYSACGHAEVTGLGVCLVTYTVGSLPCMSAAALAVTENLPVVFLSGAPGDSERGRSVLHHMIYGSNASEVDDTAAIKAFASLGMRAERLTDSPESGKRLLDLIAHAYRASQPVFIEVPRDLFDTIVLPVRLPASLDEVRAHPHPQARTVATELASRLRQAKRPLLFFGERIKLNRPLRAEILSFCEAHRIPFASNILAKGLFDEHSELDLGVYNGAFTDPVTRSYIENEVDLVLTVGLSRLTQDTATAFDTGTFALDSHPNRMDLSSESPTCEDVRDLLRHLSDMELPVFAFQGPVKTEPPLPAKDATIGYDNIVAVLDGIQRQRSECLVYLSEIGSLFFAGFSLKTRAAEAGRAWLTNPFYGAMGTSLPYARALSKLVKREGFSDVPIVLTGDGGFHFQLNDLIHFLKEDLFVVILYFRNNVFHLGKCSDSLIYGCNDERFDVIRLIQAYGGEAWTCRTIAELQEGLERCLARRTGINLFEIPLAPDEGRQSREITLLNTYIRAKSGDAESMERWQQVR